MKLPSGAYSLLKAEQCHEPAGSPAGGQFCGDGGGTDGGSESSGSGKGKVEVDSLSKFRQDKVGVSATGGEKEFLATWNKHVGMEPAEFKKSFLGDAKGEMSISSRGFGVGKDREVFLEITGKLKDDDGKIIGKYVRQINTKNKTADSALLEIDKSAQSKGTAKQLLEGNIKTYRELGLKHVDVHANIDVGGYAWAKYGYVPDKSSWNALQKQMNARLEQSNPAIRDAVHKELGPALKSKDPKAIWVVSDNKRFGKSLLLGSDWKGKLAFKDKEAMTRFDSYVGRKKSAAKMIDIMRAIAPKKPGSKNPKSEEFFYIDDDGNVQDAALHDEILSNGDDEAAQKVSDAVKARILEEKAMPMLNRAYSLLEIKQVDEESRQITGMATTPAADRLQDIVEPLGAQFKLPIPFLWQHDSGQPIGHVTHAKVGKSGIEIIAKIARIAEPGRLKDRLDEAWQSFKTVPPLVGGLSIGFKPIEHEFIKETKGVRFTKYDLLELSAVTIPANAECTIATVKSIDTAQRAASGQRKPHRVVYLNPPGASGRSQPKP